MGDLPIAKPLQTQENSAKFEHTTDIHLFTAAMYTYLYGTFLETHDHSPHPDTLLCYYLTLICHPCRDLESQV